MKIEKYSLDRDIKAICVQASSFPAGVQEAFEKLHRLVPDGMTRRTFGISRPEAGGGIIYKAAAEEKYDGEAETLGLESFTIKQGEYYSVPIQDFMNNLPAIGQTFNTLLQQPGIDPQGYCLEWYVDDKDLRCMVPVK